MIIQSAYGSVLQITLSVLHLLRQTQGTTHGNWQDKGQSLTKMAKKTPYCTELSWSRQSGQRVICAWPKFINSQWFQLGLQQILAPLKPQILKTPLTQNSNMHWTDLVLSLFNNSLQSREELCHILVLLQLPSQGCWHDKDQHRTLKRGKQSLNQSPVLDRW